MNHDLQSSEDSNAPKAGRSSFPFGGGEMATRIREFDWANTPLGPIESWPVELCVATNLILANAFPMAILWGQELIFIYNDGYRLIINHKHPDALGKSTKDIWPEVWDFNRPIFDRVLKAGETINFEDQLFRIDRHWESEETYFTLCYGPIRLQNSLIGGALVILQETTRYIVAERGRRGSEQLLRKIIDSTPSHIFAFDTKNQFTLVNKALADFCHLTKEDIQGKTLHDIFPEEIAKRVELTNSEIMSMGQTGYFEEEIESLARRKKSLHMTSKFPIRDEAGKIIGMGGVSTDISERKQLEEELIEAKIRAENLAQLKSKFLDTAAHELRTPVAIILLLVEMLQRSRESDELLFNKKLLKLRDVTSRLKILINDLLDVSRLERGLITLQLESVNLNHMIKKCVEDFHLLAPERKFLFHSPPSQIEVSIDRIRILQVISNFMDNALKYTPEKSTIEVKLEEKDNKICVSVLDHGPGIDQEMLSSLFKVNSLFCFKSNGLGLGLSISRGIIELHGGQIGVISKMGVGSTFYFELPKLKS